MVEIVETQPERTDLPLVVMPVVVASMIEPFKRCFGLLENVARVRMYEDFTLDEDTIVARCDGADAVMVIGFHCTDSILERTHAKCYAFGGTGVASYINLEKAKAQGIRVCNVVHYGDHAVAEHTMALLMELTRHVGQLDREVKAGDWAGNDGYELFGKKLGIIGLGGIGQTVARIANAYGMKVSAWNSHVPEQVLTDCNVTPVDDMNELIAGSDVVSIHMPLLDSTRGIITAENLEALRPAPCSSTRHAPKSSNPEHCSSVWNVAIFPPHSTYSSMSRSAPMTRCAGFPASCSPRTPHGVPMAHTSASPSRSCSPSPHSSGARISTSSSDRQVG